MPTTSIPIIAASITLSLVIWQLLSKKSRGNPQGLPLPPGPKPLPLIGNVLDMPKDYPWKTFQQWCKQYGMSPIFGHLYCSSKIGALGDLVYVNVFGQSIIIVGSAEVAYDLFEKKSSKYSGRAHSTMIVDLYVYANCFLECIADVAQDGLGLEFWYDELWRAMEEASEDFPPILQPKCCGEVSARPNPRIPCPPQTPYRKP
jgi:hypothetical protein